MNQTSLWLDGYSISKEKPTIQNKKIDVCIIGGGIAGISTAFALKDSELNVILIDKGTIGFGATAYTTAKISYLQELPYQKIVTMHGIEAAKLYYNSQKQAFNQIKYNIDTYHIDCDYQTVKDYILANASSSITKVKKEEALLKKWNVPYQTITTLPLPISFQYGIGVSSAVFHPLKYLYGLKKQIELKIPIYENVFAKKINKNKNSYTIETDIGKLEATYVVVATHYPFFIIPSYIPFKTHVEKSYVIASKTKDIHDFSCITTGTPMHSIRYHNDYLIYGSYAHALTNHLDDEKNFKKIKERFQNHFQKEIDYIWFNQDLIPNDGLPFIGETEKGSHLFIATGFHTWGMTNGTIAGTIIADLIQHSYSPYEDLFMIKRNWNLSRVGHFIVDACRYAKIYLQTILIQNPKFYRDHVCVINENGTRIGIYIDDKGIQHKVYNQCPHMKCNLIFNEKEKTWDCPCHSSRFDIDGNVIRGPSMQSIKISK